MNIMKENDDWKAYRLIKLWNQDGFKEVNNKISEMMDFAEEHNHRGKFALKVKETGETMKLIIVIELEK